MASNEPALDRVRRRTVMIRRIPHGRSRDHACFAAGCHGRERASVGMPAGQYELDKSRAFVRGPSTRANSKEPDCTLP